MTTEMLVAVAEPIEWHGLRLTCPSKRVEGDPRRHIPPQRAYLRLLRIGRLELRGQCFVCASVRSPMLALVLALKRRPHWIARLRRFLILCPKGGFWSWSSVRPAA